MTPASADEPLVSIGVPLYQAGKDADRALSRLLSQTYGNLELLISDNASTDGSGERAAEIAQGDSRISYTRLASTVSAPENFTAVLNRAKGTYFMWAAHDDDWDLDHIRRLVTALELDRDAAVACAIPQDVDEQQRLVSRHEGVSELATRDRAERLARFIDQPEAGGKANIIYGLFRRETLLQTDALSWLADQRLTDYHAVLAVLVQGHLTVDPSLTFYKRLHRSDIQPLPATGLRQSTRAFASDIRRTLRWLDGYQRVIDNAGLPAKEEERLHRVLRRRRLHELTAAAARFTRLAVGAIRRRVA